MPIVVHSAATNTSNSLETGRALGEQLRRQFATPPAAVVAYTTICHDHAAFLQGLRANIGTQSLIIGCSSQGVMSKGMVVESAYAAGVMGFGGEGVQATTAVVHDICENSREKGRTLGRDLLAVASSPPKVVVIHFDPFGGADADAMLAGLHEVVNCPVIGGAAGQTWGPIVATFQFADVDVFSHSAVALALSGDFTALTHACHGTAPVGIMTTVTESDGPLLKKLDGRAATEVWREMLGDMDPDVDRVANMALGYPHEQDRNRQICRVIGPANFDEEKGWLIMPATLPQGTELMFHHRTEDSVLKGTAEMAARVREELAGRTLRAVLGFECGARTTPFLGQAATQLENDALQRELGLDIAWLGMLAWGEVFSLERGPVVFHYTYPVLCLAD